MMTPNSFHRDAVDPHTVGVLAWRRRRLERAGFDSGLAGELADDARVDGHALLGLVDRGCPPELAARILAPLDDDEGRTP
jgi:hypothetical protein